MFVVFPPFLVAELKYNGAPHDPEMVSVAPKYALLIGVNDYKPGSGISTLSGTHNDVELIRSMLTLPQYGFTENSKPSPRSTSAPCGEQTSDSNVRTLCSSQATKKAILDTFRSHLIERSKSFWNGRNPEPSKGPTVFFYYSGHGSQVADLEPIEGEQREQLKIDELDGKDETIVAHDSDGKGNRDIRDDTFEELINELRTYTENITFMSDSCHSGTITRGFGQKGIERPLGDVKIGVEDARSANKGDGMAADPGYVTISGSLPTQFSFEVDLLSGRENLKREMAY